MLTTWSANCWTLSGVDLLLLAEGNGSRGDRVAVTGHRPVHTQLGLFEGWLAAAGLHRGAAGQQKNGEE